MVIPSINRGRPFILEDKSKPISKAVLSLAKTVRQQINEISKMEAEQAELVGV
jgi:MinD-like ATPase involved in chromosome partitioning or flagellar assembly